MRKIGYFAMVISGIAMLTQFSSDLLTANQGDISTSLISKGMESKLKWQNANYALEFTYDEGFEFEQAIPFSELSKDQQKIVESKKQNADRIIIEIVYQIGSKSYEAYYFRQKIN